MFEDVQDSVALLPMEKKNTLIDPSDVAVSSGTQLFNKVPNLSSLIPKMDDQIKKKLAENSFSDIVNAMEKIHADDSFTKVQKVDDNQNNVQLICTEIMLNSEDEDSRGTGAVPDELLDDLCIDENNIDNEDVNEEPKDDEPVPNEIENPEEMAVEKEPSERPYFNFKLNSAIVVQNKHRKSFRCDICSVKYRHMYSLKRHYFKTHINRKYISQQDLVYCAMTQKGSKTEDVVENTDKSSEFLDGKNLNVEVTSVKAASATDEAEKDSTEIHIVVNFVENKKAVEQNIPEKKKVAMPGLYKCNLCLRLYDTCDDLRAHIPEHRGAEEEDNNFRCQHCDMVFSMKRYLLRHMTVHSGRKTKKKGLNFISEENQIMLNDAEIDFSCSKCSKTFSNSDELRGHVETHDKDDFLEADKKKSLSIGLDNPSYRYGCTLCKKLFSNYLNMCRHRRLAHQISHRVNGKIRSFNASSIYSIADKSRIKPYMYQYVHVEETDNIDPDFYDSIPDLVRNNLDCYIDGTADSLKMSNIATQEQTVKSDANAGGVSESLKLSVKSYERVIDLAQQVVAKLEMEGCMDSCEDRLVKRDIVDDDCPVKENDVSLFVCFTCCNVFFNKNELIEHKALDHPRVLSTHLEMINETECPPEVLRSGIDSAGLLNDSSTDADDSVLRCTKCDMTFDCTPTLHSHMLECGEDKSLAPGAAFMFRHIVKRRRQKGMKRHFDNESESIVPIKTFVSSDGDDKPKSSIKPESSLKVGSKSVPEAQENPELQNLLPEQQLRCEGCFMKFEYIAALDRHQRACTMARRLNGIKSSARGLYSRHNQTTKRSCQHCLRTFDYLGSLRKHMEEGCIQKDLSVLRKKTNVKKEKDLIKKKVLPAATSSEPVSGEETPSSETSIPEDEKPGKTSVEIHMCEICHKIFTEASDCKKHIDGGCPLIKAMKLLEQSNDNKTTKDAGSVQQAPIGPPKTQKKQTKVCGSPKDKPKSSLQTFSCDICHKIYFSYVRLLKHRLAHKLGTAESEQTKLQIEEIERKYNDVGTNEPTTKEQNKPTEDASSSQAEKKVYPPEECTCPTCGRLFASPLNMGRHNRMAHGMIREALNKRHMILSNQTKEERALNPKFRVSVSKVDKDGQQSTEFVIQSREMCDNVPKKPGRKPKVANADNAGAANANVEQQPKKRGWPKGRCRKKLLAEALPDDATVITATVVHESTAKAATPVTSSL